MTVFSALGAAKISGSKMHVSSVLLLALGALFTLCVDVSELVMALIGAIAYVALSKLAPRPQRKNIKPLSKNLLSSCDREAPTERELFPRRSSASALREYGCDQGKGEQRTASVKPVSAPKFQTGGFEQQVEELMKQISPSSESDAVVRGIRAAVRRALNVFMPEADVVGFACGDVRRGGAFGVAIPSVDIVLNAERDALVGALHRRGARHGDVARLGARHLQKAALRACTDDLVSAGGFKFRRSAFSGDEPKIILLAPSSQSAHSDGIPINFSVNATTPLRSMAIFTDCGLIDQRAQELILLVRRWAKDRGISFAAKGHLSPYAWTILTVYFLQVGGATEQTLLPSLHSFKRTSALLHGRAQLDKQANPAKTSDCSAADVEKKSVASLFSEFARFYTEAFDWESEAVSVRAGKRAPLPTLRQHVVVDENGSALVAPGVEDPFSKQNLSEGMNVFNIRRLQEELSRAADLCSQQVCLESLLEPWQPPEAQSE